MAAILRLHRLAFVIPLALAVAGCGSSSDSGSSGGVSMDQMAAQLDAQEAARQQELAKQATQPEAGSEPSDDASVNNEPPERTVAGRQGVGEGGYYTAIVGARRHILNQVEGLAWKQAVQHFKATEGRKPKDHEEFMNKIVKPLEIDLGYKEEDQEFLYDPSAESEGDLGVLYVVAKEPAQE